MDMDSEVEQLRKDIGSLTFRCSSEGGNSISNFRNISVFPSTSELVRPSEKKIPRNVIKGPYINSYEYLNTHFCLLREDFIKPIRENVISFLKDINEKLQSVKIHEVQYIRNGVKNGAIGHCFEIKKGITYLSWDLKRSDKRFMMGSLLIFSRDNFKTSFCGRVADNRNMEYRKVLVTFEKPITLQYKQNYTMVECNTFFEPYFHVLKVLQSICDDSLLMQKYLIKAESSVGLPKYLNGIKHTISDPTLNKSQLVALNGALSQELVIIQGPPGTGKTFLGLKIVKELLLISKKWFSDSPMLIISCTNHALDQFLEGLVAFTDKILRFGAQSKNPLMKNFSLRECRLRYYQSNENGSLCRKNIAPLYSEYRNIESQIRDIENQIDILTSQPTFIFYFDILAKGVPEINELFSSERDDEVVSWLLEEDGTMMEKDIAPSVFHVPACHDTGRDSKKMAEMFRQYINDAAQKIYDIIGKISKGMEKKKRKCRSIGRNVQHVLKEKKKIIEKLNEDYKYLIRKIEYLKICLTTDFNNNIDRLQVDMNNPFKIPVRVRWQLYTKWLNQYEAYMRERLDAMIAEYEPIYENFSAVEQSNTLTVMRHQRVIGMTTTSAARLHSTIKALQCPIVIVEEAAEVLEAHIIPVLTEHCQHLILLGDHQQLKPTTADYEIETQYELGVSLFERMVNNNVQCHTLNVQHRMRPEISSLITPSIYPVLYDHESVKRFPKIAGVEKSLYFITHNEPEKSSGYSSKRNIHEAEFLIEFAAYLLKNDYKPEEITILGAYLGQVGTLLRVQKKYRTVKDVKITSVDNFQGEENKIILLSLVRNNPKKNIGFLSINNRVCVALSRAREGLYIMGNMEQLSSSSELWQKLKCSFEGQNALGTALPLKCQRHGKITKVRIAENFTNQAPNGGCKTICNTRLSCGHRCQIICHNDVLVHKKYKCIEPCLRSPCDNPAHQCEKQCYQDCGLCMHQLRQKLSCGHYVKCYMKEMEVYQCEELIYVRLSCGHKLPVSCNAIDSDFAKDWECFICRSKKGENDTFATSDEDDLQEVVELTKNINLLDISSDEESDLEIEIPEELEIYNDPTQTTFKEFKRLFYEEYSHT